MCLIVLKIILFIMFAYGLTFGLVYSRGLFGIFEKIRNLADEWSNEISEMLKCTFCTPCNIGLWCSVLNLIFLPTIPLTPAFLIIDDISLWYYIVLADIFFTGSSVLLIDTIQNRIDINNNNQIDVINNSDEK